MQEVVEKIAVAEIKKELLNFTVNALKYDGVISDMTFNQWRSIKGGSLFDGVNTMCDCWQYGLQLNYVQIPIKRDVIKLKLTVSDVGLTLIKETVLEQT